MCNFTVSMLLTRVALACVALACAEEARVDSFETDVEACAICLDTLVSDVDALPCGHRFHGGCKASFVAQGLTFACKRRDSLGNVSDHFLDTFGKRFGQLPACVLLVYQ